MLEKLATWVLNTYLGEYLCDINPDQIKVGLLNGNIELEDVPLRKDALRSLKLPLEIKDGYVGRLQLQIPLRRMRSEPWVVKIEHLYLLVKPAPKKNNEDMAAEQVAAVEEKMKALESWEKQRLNKEGASPAGQATFGASFLAAVVENLQFVVTDVHIRYEDNVTIPGQTFAAGATIEKISAQSANADWKTESCSITDVARKLLELDKFSIYWDAHFDVADDSPERSLVEYMGEKSTEHDFVLNPVSGCVRLTRSLAASPLRSLDTPRFLFDAELEHINLRLTRSQYRQAMILAETTQQYVVAWQRRRLRPTHPVSENPAAWWRYAIFGCAHGLQERLRQSNNSFLLQCLHDNVVYARAYRRAISVEEDLTDEEGDDMDRIETNRPLDEILVLRSAVRRNLKRDEELQEPNESEVSPVPDPSSQSSSAGMLGGAIQSWFPGWSGWADPAAKSSDGQDVIDGLTEEEEDLMKSVQFVQSDESLLTRDALFARVNCCLHGAAVELCSTNKRLQRATSSQSSSDDEQLSVRFDLSNVNIAFDGSPRTQASKLKVSLETLHLHDLLHKDSLFPVLIAPQTRLDEDHPVPSQFRRQYSLVSKKDAVSRPLFCLMFEKNPPNSVSNCRLKVQCQPLDIVYHPIAMQCISQFFAPLSAEADQAALEAALPGRGKPGELSAAARRRYEQWKDDTKAGFQNTLDGLISIPETKAIQRWSLDFDVAAPQVIIPESLTDEKAPMVVVDLGHLKLETSATEAVKKVQPEPPATSLVLQAESSLSDDSDDDGFATPMSTPPASDAEDDDEDVVDFAAAVGRGLDTKRSNADNVMGGNGSGLQPPSGLEHTSVSTQNQKSVDRLYDKYLMKMSELQVLVGHRQDGWQQAHSQRHSSLHVVDRFNIDVQLYRRVALVCDRRLPGAAVCADLPSLQLHVDEQKIAALRSCMKNLSKNESAATPHTPSPSKPFLPPASLHPTPTASPFSIESMDDSDDEMFYSVYQSTSAVGSPRRPISSSKKHQKRPGSHGVSAKTTLEEGSSITSAGNTTVIPSGQSAEEHVDLRLLVVHFSVGTVSVGLNSRGHSITELQVKNLIAAVIVRPFDYSVSLMLQELLLVDALQKFGSDYELLVASKTSSCCFKTPDDLPSEPVGAGDSITEPATNWSRSSVSLEELVSLEGLANIGSDALLMCEMNHFNADCPGREGEGALNVIVLTFSNLNIIANQETVAELVSFAKRAFPEDNHRPESAPQSQQETDSSTKPAVVEHVEQMVKTDITATAKQLSIVVVRGRAELRHLREQQSRRSASAQWSPGTQSLPSKLVRGASSSASLLGQHPEEVSPQVARIVLHGARILASFSSKTEVNGVIGGVEVTDLTPEGQLFRQVFSVGTQASAAFSSGEFGGIDTVDAEALNFSWSKAVRGSQPGPTVDETSLTIRLASMRYLHSPQFLEILKNCAADFQQYLSKLLQQAAKEVALGVVVHGTKSFAEKIDLLSTSFMHQSSIVNLDDSDAADASSPAAEEVSAEEDGGLKLNVTMESPVIAIPKSSSSGQIIVLNLGHMDMQNSFEKAKLPQFSSNDPEKAFFMEEGIERRTIQVRNIHLAALQLNVDKMQDWFNQSPTPGSLPPYFVTTNNACGSVVDILHETEIAATVDTPCSPVDEDGDDIPRLYVHMKVVSSLRVSLSKDVFQQIISTLDAISSNQPPLTPPPAGPSTASKKENSPTSRRYRQAQKTEAGVIFMPSPSTSTGSVHILSDSDDAAGQSTRSWNGPKLHIQLHVPIMMAELRTVLHSGEQGLVDVSLHDFTMHAVQTRQYVTGIEISLRSLLMEDLLEKRDSRYRFLMSSAGLKRVSSARAGAKTTSSSGGLFSSFPAQMPQLAAVVPLVNAFSLPSASPSARTSTPNTPRRTLLSQVTLDGLDECDTTPFFDDDINEVDGDHGPSSAGVGDETLVQVKVRLVDKAAPTFLTEFGGVNRSVDVDFNSLDTTVNQQTWVALLDFFGIGTPKPPSEPSTHAPSTATSPDSSIPTTPVAGSFASSRPSSGEASQPENPPSVPPSGAPQNAASSLPFVQPPTQEPTTDLKVRVHSLSLTLNKPLYPLAKASVAGLDVGLTLKDGNLSLNGSLKTMSLVDLTPAGSLYRERFTTIGNEALVFEVFKYGPPDWQNLREYDMKVHLRMASVRYVHTKRFQMELVSFFQHFTQVMDALPRMRANAAGTLVYNGPTRSGRILLDIEAGTPVALLPRSANSHEMLVINLGNVSVHNSFRYAENVKPPPSEKADSSASATAEAPSPQYEDLTSPTGQSPPSSPSPMTSSVYFKAEDLKDSELFSGHFPHQGDDISADASKRLGRNKTELASPITEGLITKEANAWLKAGHYISGPCLLDVLKIELSKMDVFSARRVPVNGQSAFLSPRGPGYDDVDGPGDDSFTYEPTSGRSLEDKCTLSWTIERNLHQDFCHDVPDNKLIGQLSSVHILVDRDQLQLVKGVLADNLGEDVEDFERPETFIRDPIVQTKFAAVWTGLDLQLHLVNVSVELLHQHAQGHMPRSSLACFEFRRSQLHFEARSDTTKTIDLVSQAIVARDTRYTGFENEVPSNVFSEILQPRHLSSSLPEGLQLEIHYRTHVLPHPRRQLNILLNKVRLLGVFEWLLAVKDFIVGRKEESEEEEEEELTAADITALGVSLQKAQMLKRARSELQEKEEEVEKPIDVHLNMAETEVLVLENAANPNTNAVTLKFTLVMSYRSILNVGVALSCSLQDMEVFSCNLGNEEDTALSIIDPLTISAEVRNPNSRSAVPTDSVRSRTQGMSSMAGDIACLPPFEITMQTVAMRVSYHDIQLFSAILRSLPGQAAAAGFKTSADPQSSMETSIFQPVDERITKLELLGYEARHCKFALDECGGDLNEAATWLASNAPAKAELDAVNADEGSNLMALQIGSILVHAHTISVCFIDDCGGRDVPLAELSLLKPQIFHDIRTHPGNGQASATLVMEYYNRGISAWEPLLEPWKFNAHWLRTRTLNSSHLTFKIDASDRLDITVTSAFLNLVKSTQHSWLEDFRRTSSASQGERSCDLPASSDEQRSQPVATTSLTSAAAPVANNSSRRTPFTPFVLQNNTGSSLHFATLTSTPSRVTSLASAPIDSASVPSVDAHANSGFPVGAFTSMWRDVPAGSEESFQFHSHTKRRHYRDTRRLHIHQIVVHIKGWKQVSPVTVDRVGVYFRDMAPEESTSLPPVRLVFAVRIGPDARKIVNVRSALVLHNRLSSPLDIRVRKRAVPRISSGVNFSLASSVDGGSDLVDLPTLSPGERFAVPLQYTSWQLVARPSGPEWRFASECLQWDDVDMASPISDTVVTSRKTSAQQDVFRFIASIKREPFPAGISAPSSETEALIEDAKKSYVSITDSQSLEVIEPTEEDETDGAHAGVLYFCHGHTITFRPPVTLVNLLPTDMEYFIGCTNHHGVVKAGKEKQLCDVDPTKVLHLGVQLDGFHRCEDIKVPPGIDSVDTLVLRDINRRTLNLHTKVESQNGSLTLSVLCSYWLRNHTGLPLVFKQDGAAMEAAGQTEANEKARSLTPLLFSFADPEKPNACCVRLGRSPRLDGSPVWCPRFRLDRNTGLGLKLIAVQGPNAPDGVYEVGLHTRRGKGRYAHTLMVTFVTRFQLQNHSQYTLAYSQRFAVARQNEELRRPPAQMPPCAVVPFHWQRTDLDQALCVRVADFSNCRWSGGFQIEKESSFHITMRHQGSYNVFLRVDVVLRGATYHVGFYDAHQLPPPLKIENLSPVPVYISQRTVPDRTLRTLLNAYQCVPYAWDEPSLEPEFRIEVAHSNDYRYCDTKVFGEKEGLYYDNFMYIMATCTMVRHPSYQEYFGSGGSAVELVLDVPQGKAVLFRKKDAHSRTQLWRITTRGHLENVGLSKSRTAKQRRSIVLDIVTDATRAFSSHTCMPLQVCPVDETRAATQTWSFTEDGRLACGTLFVQPLNGIRNLQEGCDAGAAPTPIHRVGSGVAEVPTCQLISSQRQHPGSGALTIRLKPAGPTKLLQIFDMRDKRLQRDSLQEDWIMVDVQTVASRKLVMNRIRSNVGTNVDAEPDHLSGDFKVVVRLAGGVGVSLVDHQLEELCFMSLTGIEVDFTSNQERRLLEATVQSVQIDNQMYAPQRPVILSRTPLENRAGVLAGQPTIRLVACQLSTWSTGCKLFERFELSLQPLTVCLEERLLYALVQYAGIHQESAEDSSEDLDLESPASLSNFSETGTKHFYFADLILLVNQLKLSFLTSSRLPDDLKKVKKSLHTPVPFVKFEDAILAFESFKRQHVFETQSAIVGSAVEFYKKHFVSQFASILGSTDFLGNPLGFFNDFTSAMADLAQLNMSGAVAGITHGISDSATKLTGVVSEGLGRVTMDKSYQEERLQLTENCQSSGDHLVAGLAGLAHGVLGGLTSVVHQTYQGSVDDGVTGFISGFGKGLIGTVTKPAVGVLDLATGTAAAVRHTTQSSIAILKPVRMRRCCAVPGGALPSFNEKAALGQQYLLQLNNGDPNEMFVAFELLRNTPEDKMSAIISTEQVFFLGSGKPVPKSVVLQVAMCDLVGAEPVFVRSKGPTPSDYYVRLIQRGTSLTSTSGATSSSAASMTGSAISVGGDAGGIRTPRVKCSQERIARKVAQEINYAKGLHEQRMLMVPLSDVNGDIW